MAHKLGRPYSFSQKKALFQAQKGQTRQAAAALGRGAPWSKEKSFQQVVLLDGGSELQEEATQV